MLHSLKIPVVIVISYPLYLFDKVPIQAGAELCQAQVNLGLFDLEIDFDQP